MFHSVCSANQSNSCSGTLSSAMVGREVSPALPVQLSRGGLAWRSSLHLWLFLTKVKVVSGSTQAKVCSSKCRLRMSLTLVLKTFKGSLAHPSQRNTFECKYEIYEIRPEDATLAFILWAFFTLSYTIRFTKPEKCKLVMAISNGLCNIFNLMYVHIYVYVWI